MGDHRIEEIVIVDDGSKDHTAQTVSSFARIFPFPIRYLYQQNQGLAAARNRAVREARGTVILFGDDDIIPERTMVAEHLAWHARYPDWKVGVLGHVDWAPAVRPTTFMKWEGLYGPQFHFGYFNVNAELEYNQAYFCNTSVKAALLQDRKLFSEEFRGYGWEDIEFSYRLYKIGFRMRYCPSAIGYHYKYESFADAVRRTKKLWLDGWPVFIQTEAGQYSAQVWQHKRSNGLPAKRSVSRRARLIFERAAAPLCRVLVDSRLGVPFGLCDWVWYQYSKPIYDHAFNVHQQRSS
jgi:GT2 family glycosyltransferase